METIYELRTYQKKAYSSIKSAFRLHKAVILQLDTGAGKTVIFSQIIADSFSKGRRVVVFVHRTSLLNQTVKKLAEFGISCQQVTARTNWIDTEKQVCVCMIQTIKSRINKYDYRYIIEHADLLIFDECHRQEYNEIFKQKLNKNYVLGLSATPAREGKQRQLYFDYQLIIQNIISKEQLIKQGDLVPFSHKSIEMADRAKAEVNSFGEITGDASYKLFNNRKCFSGIIDNWQKFAMDKKTLVFASNIRHAVEICKMFNDNQISCKFAVSELSMPKCKDIDNPKKYAEYLNALKTYELVQDNLAFTGKADTVLKEFIHNKFKVLVNVDIYTTGTDVPDIECIIAARVINSRNLWYQIYGRGSRPCKSINKSNCIMLDFGGNVDALGRFEYSYDFSLIHKTPRDSKNPPPVKECEKCGALVSVSAKYCDFCGAQLWHEKKKAETELVDYDQKINFSEKKVLRKEISTLVESTKDTRLIPNRIISQYGKEGWKEYCDYKNYDKKYYGYILKMNKAL